ncbi:extracellular solute-binding protein [Cohnella nanjingensis]|uniref:Extracellular solute-binding protein n=1 Tax=Cohnella nanjingensis TaxID=1387779 RepID=A0A7X0VFX4_9BACL|nr:extracellular solute-binding protein [Cohnella nanjingensis]MBB6672520.1 extracellular solute-binding protein [Cohnella nanjingensis]
MARWFGRTALTVGIAISMAGLVACSNGGKGAEPSAGSIASAGASGTAAAEAHDPFGKYEQPLEVSVGKFLNLTDKTLPAGDTPTNNQFTRYLEDKLNVKIKAAWQAGGDAYSQKVSVAIASGDLPDAMVVYSYSDLRKLVEANLLQDMTDTINDYASPLIKDIYTAGNDAALKAATFNGRVMAIPASQGLADSMYMMWIRQDWLDQLGLQPPRTVDELENVIGQFIKTNPDKAQNPIGLPAGNLYGMTNSFPTLNPLFAVYHSYPNNWVRDSEGKAASGLIQPETKEALGKMREMYAAGLIDKEFALRKDPFEPIINGSTGVFFGPWWMGFTPLNEAMNKNPQAKWKAYLLPLDKDGQFNTHVQSPANMFYVVRKGIEHPEAIMKMVNVQTQNELGLDPDAHMDLKVDWVNEPLRAPIAYPDSIEKDSEKVHEALDGKLPVDKLTSVQKRVYDNYLKTKDNPTADIGGWSEAFSYVEGAGQLLRSFNKVPSLYYGETETMTTKGATLGKLQQETINKIIMGAAPLDSFDQFVKDWKRLGGDQITAEVNEAIK